MLSEINVFKAGGSDILHISYRPFVNFSRSYDDLTLDIKIMTNLKDL